MDSQTCKFQVNKKVYVKMLCKIQEISKKTIILNSQPKYPFKVGSFNYDNTKMVYRTYYLPLMPNSTESILDYEVEIASLKVEDTFYLPAETGNYSVAGFEMVLNRLE